MLFSVIELGFALRETRSPLGGTLAIAALATLNVGLGRVYIVAFEWLKARQWDQPRSGSVALSIAGSIGLTAVPVVLVAFLLGRLV